MQPSADRNEGYDPNDVASVEDAIVGRRSTRRFRSDPVDSALVEELLDIAARAPSGTNMQPWRVFALAGRARQELSQAVLDAHNLPQGTHAAEYEYYPSPFFDPYLGRRRKVGYDLYGLLGISRGETDRMHAQHGRNFTFFDAPVGMIFTIDRRLKIGSWLDYGMFLQNLMLAARGKGLDTCVQAAFASFHAAIREHLPIPDEHMVVCGMSLGYADRDAPENRLTTERVPARDFATFVGWEKNRAE